MEGTRAKEIAARLDLSPKTIDTYRASLMRKLDIHDVAGLVKFAIQRDFDLHPITPFSESNPLLAALNTACCSKIARIACAMLLVIRQLRLDQFP